MAKTVKVRIAVAVDAQGNWDSYGWSKGRQATAMETAGKTLEGAQNGFWLEVELPIPEIESVTPQVVHVTTA